METVRQHQTEQIHPSHSVLRLYLGLVTDVVRAELRVEQSVVSFGVWKKNSSRLWPVYVRPFGVRGMRVFAGHHGREE